MSVLSQEGAPWEEVYCRHQQGLGPTQEVS